MTTAAKATEPGVRAVRIHQETNRDSRIYSLEVFDGERSWTEPLWSVTTLLKALDKPALPRWAAAAVAEHVVENAGYLAQDLERFGPKEVRYQLSQAPYKSKSRAAEIGTAVHEQIDAIVRGAERPPVPPDLAHEVLPRLQQFLRFEQEWRPRYGGAEMTVVNPEHGWAGTLDMLAEIGERGLGLIDVKCTKEGKGGKPGVYVEHPLQVAAYAHATEIVPIRGAWAEPVPMPPVQWGAVLWLNTERYELVEVDISEATYRAFRVAAEIFRYMDGPGKRSILGPRASSQFGVPPAEATDEQAAAVRAFTLAPAGADLDADPGPERPADAVDVPQEDAPPRYCSEQQRKRLLGIASKRGHGHHAVKRHLATLDPPIDSTKKVPAGRVYDEVVAHYEAMPVTVSQAESPPIGGEGSDV